MNCGSAYSTQKDESLVLHIVACHVTLPPKTRFRAHQLEQRNAFWRTATDITKIIIFPVMYHINQY